MTNIVNTRFAVYSKWIRILLLFSILLILIPNNDAKSDEIHLWNGQIFEVDSYKEENGRIYFEMVGAEASIPKESVSKIVIDRTKDKKYRYKKTIRFSNDSQIRGSDDVTDIVEKKCILGNCINGFGCAEIKGKGWQKGGKYNGYWKNGMRNGQGRFDPDWQKPTFGIWENDILIKKLVYKSFDLIKEAEGYISIGEYYKAKTPLIWELKRNPNNYDVYFLRGQINTFQGISKEAIKDLKFYINNSSSVDSQAYYFIALCHIKEKKFDEAKLELKYFINNSPSVDNQIYIFLAKVYAKEKRYDEAVEYVDALLSNSSNHVEGYFLRANIKFDFSTADGNYLKNEKILESAIEDYTSVIKLDRNSKLAYYNRHRAYEFLNKIEFAKSDYFKAIELGIGSEYPPENILATLNEIEWHIKNNRSIAENNRLLFKLNDALKAVKYNYKYTKCLMNSITNCYDSFYASDAVLLQFINAVDNLEKTPKTYGNRELIDIRKKEVYKFGEMLKKAWRETLAYINQYRQCEKTANKS